MFRPEKQVPIKLIVGLGAAAASAAFAAFYVLSKKEEESFELDPRLELSNSIPVSLQSRSTTILKYIPNEAIGAVIGKGGENIKQIQRKTNTKINCSNTANEDEDRTIVIKGSPSGTLAADELIDNIIEKSLTCIVHRIYIAPSEVGLVIGKYGCTIKQISEESGAKVNIPKTPKGSKQQHAAVEIRGEPASVQTAIKMINDKLKFSRSSRSRSHTASPIFDQRNEKNGHQNNYINFIPTFVNIFDISMDRFERLESDVDNGCQDVYVSSVQSPSKFWVQPCGTISADLDRLMIDMTDYYEKKDNQIKSRLLQLNIGDIVAAEGEEHWFRVKIVSYHNPSSLPGDGEVTIYYLDFGDESIVCESKICALHEEFLNRLNFQAIECSLFGVEPISSSWSDESIDYFRKTARTSFWEKVFVKTQKVINLNEPRQHFIVEMFTLQVSSDINIAQCLIEKGFAISTDQS